MPSQPSVSVTESVRQDLSEKLRQIYNGPPEENLLHTARYEKLLALYRLNFPRQTSALIVRAPGRVNLVGDHTDYNGYPVMPMAIDRDIVIVLGPHTGKTIDVVNETPSIERRSFDARFPVSPFAQGDWGNYIKAAVHGILEAGWVDQQKVKGFQAVVGGTIPESAGLSSSSALVVASALAFLAANAVRRDSKDLADLLAHAERYVGSEGGGMDQAVSLLAEAGSALKIDFFPLRVQPVSLPAGLSFVVCNSLIRAPKSEAMRHVYNRRVVECKMATALIAKAIGERSGKTIHPERLSDLSGEKHGLEQRTIDKIAEQAIGEKPLSLRAIAQQLGETTGAAQQRLCTLRDGTILAEPADGFKIWNRYRHVVSEAQRVELAAAAFRAGDAASIGRLMNESHASLRDDYEASCPELEALVSIAKECGALGARLTGAGFGGCTVNAVPSSRVVQFIDDVTAAYYHGDVEQKAGKSFAEHANLRDAIFVCRPTTGGGVVSRQG